MTPVGLDRARRIWDLEARERRLTDLAESAHRRYWQLDRARRGARNERLSLEGFDEIQRFLLREGTSTRIIRALASAEIVSLGVLAAQSRRDLMRLKGVGAQTVDRLEHLLLTHGLVLRREAEAA